MYFPTIQELFNNIATQYDVTNTALSFNLHRTWNSCLVDVLPKDSEPTVLVDLCSGTGDIAFCYLKKARNPCTVTCVDFSSRMLDEAKKKVAQSPWCKPHRIDFVEADVQKLPLQNCFANSVTMAYGLRNIKNPLLGIQEAFRILKPGGTFAVLELTRPSNRCLRFCHHVYLKYAIPLLGKWFTAQKEAYVYLCQSIQSFLSPKEVEKLFVQAGFSKTRCQSLNGGIATLIIGQKTL